MKNRCSSLNSYRNRLFMLHSCLNVTGFNRKTRDSFSVWNESGRNFKNKRGKKTQQKQQKRPLFGYEFTVIAVQEQIIMGTSVMEMRYQFQQRCL